MEIVRGIRYFQFLVPRHWCSTRRQVMQKGRLQKVVQGLMYPAVLGSILVWFGQALAVYLVSGSKYGAQGIPSPPSYLVLLFASILVLYSPAA